MFAALGAFLERITDPRRRLIVSTASGVGIGIAIGLLIREQYRPDLDIRRCIGWTLPAGSSSAPR